MNKFILIILFSTLSVSASATLVQEIPDGEQILAADIFGDPSVTVSTSSLIRLRVKQWYIGAGNTAELTYTLQDGMTFQSAISTANFTVSAPGELRWSVKEGGAIDDTYVTYSVEALVDIQPFFYMYFDPSRIGNIDHLATPGETAEIIITIERTNAVGSWYYYWNSRIGYYFDTSFATSYTGYDFELLSVLDNAYVELTDRTVLTGDDVIYVDHDNDDSTDTIGSALVAQFSFNLPTGGITDAEGLAFEPDNESSGGGILTFTTEGEFNTGDTLCVLLGTSDTCVPAELSGNTATYTETLGTSDDIKLYYVPSGGGILSATEFTTTVELVYDSETHQTDLYDDLTVTQVISYDGVKFDGSASAIPSNTSSDRAFIRVTNLGGSSVLLFGEAYTQSGDELGFIELDTLDAHETRVYTQADLEDLFGSWTGRARIEFLTDGDISVQTMVRSGGVLNNITGSTGGYDNN